MKSIFYPLVLILLLLACRKLPVSMSITGDYYKSYPHDDHFLDASSELILNSDSTFILMFNEGYEYGGGCKGKWRFINKNTIRLNCFEEPLLDQLGMGYISQREWIVEILDDNKIKIDNTVLAKTDGELINHTALFKYISNLH